MSDPTCDVELAEQDYGPSWRTQKRLAKVEAELAALAERHKVLTDLRADYVAELQRLADEAQAVGAVRDM